jgi:hypothetical protein
MVLKEAWNDNAYKGQHFMNVTNSRLHVNSGNSVQDCSLF